MVPHSGNTPVSLPDCRGAGIPDDTIHPSIIAKGHRLYLPKTPLFGFVSPPSQDRSLKVGTLIRFKDKSRSLWPDNAIRQEPEQAPILFTCDYSDEVVASYTWRNGIPLVVGDNVDLTSAKEFLFRFRKTYPSEYAPIAFEQSIVSGTYHFMSHQQILKALQDGLPNLDLKGDDKVSMIVGALYAEKHTYFYSADNFPSLSNWLFNLTISPDEIVQMTKPWSKWPIEYWLFHRRFPSARPIAYTMVRVEDIKSIGGNYIFKMRSSSFTLDMLLY